MKVLKIQFKFPHAFDKCARLHTVAHCPTLVVLVSQRSRSQGVPAPRKLLETLKIYTEEETEARQEVMYENYISSMCRVTGRQLEDLWGSIKRMLS